MTDIKLGLCNPPEPIYLYVKSGEASGESYLWYRYDINNDKTIPVQERGLTGYITELRLTAKEFRGKDNLKLDIVISADELYVIRTGIETNFAKTFLLAASVVQDFTKALTIAVTPGEENVVFCRLYDALTKTRFRCEWNPNADWASLIQLLQSKLSPSAPIHPQDTRIKQIRTLLDYPVELIKEYLQFQDAKAPSQLPQASIDELVKTMCLAWADDKIERRYAEAAYQQQVLAAIASDTDEVQAIRTWMNYVLGQRAAVTAR
ncbi:hypothetical protein NIES4074_62730 (plasmid) [Cylindrospermum sp. NIES-4074]|nr:hypothetical protein NIES4074_62730 [Cylindrospermum sp. NIES-4074]